MEKITNVLDPKTGQAVIDPHTGKPISLVVAMSPDECDAFVAERAAAESAGNEVSKNPAGIDLKAELAALEARIATLEARSK